MLNNNNGLFIFIEYCCKHFITSLLLKNSKFNSICLIKLNQDSATGERQVGHKQILVSSALSQKNGEDGNLYTMKRKQELKSSFLETREQNGQIQLLTLLPWRLQSRTDVTFILPTTFIHTTGVGV